MNPGHWGIAQWIMVCLGLFSLGVSTTRHGQRQSDYNAWVSLISFGITFGLLWWGGFFL